ncbi:MAG: DNA polymerase I [Thermoanaerobacterales bacterium 50_218]|nr:MAG: DNA polymerase I [Thermoanaerobacterales bacterium 50_218]HAA89681.1 DNA polymerase I [Peptococcaceae bacterium]
MKKLVILDGNSLAHRAFYALPLLSTTTGQFTNAVYGFTNMLQKVVRQENPDYLAVAFDAGKITFRHHDYEKYKAHRIATPPELRPQFPLIKKILAALRIPVLEVEGYEADDIIGTVARAAAEQGIETMIVTGDRDMLQLVTENVHALITRKGISELERYSPELVKKKYGIEPSQIPDFKGLVGDPSDNIPGVPGIGEKTAVKLLKQFGTLEECLANLEKLPKKVRNLLEEYGEQALLSKRLATIDTKVPISVDFSSLKVEEPDYQELVGIFQELEFKSLLKNLQEELPESLGSVTSEEESLQAPMVSIEEIPAVVEKIKEAGRFAFCFERDSHPPHKAPLSRMGLAWEENRGVTIAFPQDVELQNKVLSCLSELFTDPKIEKWCHDAKAEMVMLAHRDICLEGVTGDTMLAAYLLNPASSSPTLEEVHLKYLNKVVAFSTHDRTVAGCRAAAILSVWPVLLQELENCELSSLFFDLELPLSAVLAEMELNGVKLDVDQLEEMSRELEVQLQELTEEIYHLAGEPFNINSPKQLGTILFEKLKLPVIKKTKTGYSTDASVLEELAAYHEIAAKILEYRQLMKLKSTYIDGLRGLIDRETGKVHTTFNQTITATGRLSSTEPNLQNIPIRMEAGRKIRRAFIPSVPGWMMLSADYSQIELRILAHFSQDQGLIEAFRKGEDIHARTASEIFGVPPDEVTPELRRRAKGVNFGIVYGITDFGLSRDIGVSREEAAAYIENYFLKHPGVKKFIQETINKAREQGYVTTLLKRRRYLPDLFSSNRTVRAFGERTAINTPIQGSAADIIKLAMLKVNSAIKEKGLRARMILQVHDELVFEAPSEEIPVLVPLVREGMENAVELSVPLEVDIKVGPNWYDMVEVEE